MLEIPYLPYTVFYWAARISRNKNFPSSLVRRGVLRLFYYLRKAFYALRLNLIQVVNAHSFRIPPTSDFRGSHWSQVPQTMCDHD